MILRGIIDDAERQGDLIYRAGMTAETLALAFVALVDGVMSATHGATPLDQVGIADPFAALVTSAHVLADGAGWRPFSEEWDYKDTECRIAATIIKEIDRDAFDKQAPDSEFQ